jgi:hypothetical protein
LSSCVLAAGFAVSGDGDGDGDGGVGPGWPLPG